MNTLRGVIRSKTLLSATSSTLLFAAMIIPTSAVIVATDDFDTYTQGLALNDPSQPPGGSGFSTPWDATGGGVTATVVPA